MLAAFADNSPNKTLLIVSKKIQQWQARISTNQQQYNQLQKQLKQQEIAIANAENKVIVINNKITMQQKRLEQLNNEEHRLESQLAFQRQLLHRQLRSNLLLNQSSTLKILFSQNDMNNIGRNLTLYQILLQKRVATLNNLESSLVSLKNTRQGIAAVQQELYQLRQHATINQEELHHQQQKRRSTTQSLQQEIRTAHAKVSNLKLQKKKLEKIISDLQRQASKQALLAKQKQQQESLANFQHHLAWPVTGTLAHRYGESITASDMKWRGIVITAPLRQSVHAIYAGKVIFANWLQGFGFTLIIDHGHGYMSLYARNQSLEKSEGQLVKAQEIIARVGKSGGFSESSLYFELRHNGNPINPLAWLKDN